MFKIGDLIFYGRTGVCQVVAFCERTVSAQSGPQLYYVLQPLYQACRITTPVNNSKIYIRPIISREEAEDVIRQIPNMSVCAYHSKNLVELREHYKCALETYNCHDLLGLTMSIYRKKTEAAQQKRKLGAVDERFLKEAEELLFGELAVALDIPLKEVKNYIADQVEKQVAAQSC